MSLIADIVIVTLLLLGAGFALIGSWGLVRLPTTMERLHGPTKAATLGMGSVLMASIAYFWTHHGQLSWHELLIALFVFMTAPITGLYVAKAHMHLSWKRDQLPPPPSGADWATYGRGAETSPIVTVKGDGTSRE